MATKTFIGTVGSEGVSTGPHLHQYVLDLKTKQYLDPRTFQSPLLDIRVGKDEVPLAIKNAQGQITINPAAGATVTSEFGPRSAPTAGASSQHMGRDIALSYGTPVKYFGAGQYVPESGVQGFGNLGKIITPDKRYEIGFGHLASLGTPTTQKGGWVDPGMAPSQTYEQANQRTQDLLEAFMYGTQYNAEPKEKTKKPQSFLDAMKEQVTASLLNQALNPGAGLNTPTGLPEEYTRAIWG
jgi:murein DD-endopeptidase MepM/ murein hydrolase activator NlpD